MKRSLLLFPLLFLFIGLSGFDTIRKPQIIPSTLEIGKALKQALEQGTSKAFSS
jgi:hypothetical protein